MTQPLRGQIVHAVPGRLRVRVDRHQLSAALARTLERSLQSLPGVTQVQITLQTGSILIQGEPATVEPGRLLALIAELRVLTLERADRPEDLPGEVPPSITALRIQRAFHEVDLRLSELSQRRWDLRTIVPAALGVLALRQIVTSFGELAGIPWYALAWYSFDTFWKLNHGRHVANTSADRSPESGELEPQNDTSRNEE